MPVHTNAYTFLSNVLVTFVLKLISWYMISNISDPIQISYTYTRNSKDSLYPSNNDLWWRSVNPHETARYGEIASAILNFFVCCMETG